MTTTPSQNGPDATERPTDDLVVPPQASINNADIPSEADAAMAETHADMAPILATARQGIEETTLTPEEIERYTNILLGDGFLKAGQLNSAREAYAAAGAEIPNEKVIACGDVCLKAGWLNYAREAYAAAGATEKLMAVGDVWLKKGQLNAAREVYAAAGATEKLVAVGDMWLKQGRLNAAREAYAAAAKLGAGT